MDKQIKQFEVSSPDELREALASYKQNGVPFAGVRVFGPNVLTRQFNFPNSSVKDLIAGLKLEASETLSGEADVEVSYQITVTDEQGVRGVFTAMPRHLLLEYLECFKGHALVPVSLTASAVGAVTDFLKNKATPGDNFCLVNFLRPQAVNIIIFVNGRPTFFRELYDLSDSDFKDKIADTIRYSSSQSASKNIDHIYFIGDLTGKEDLIKSLKELKNFSLNPPVASAGETQVDLGGLNLLRKFVCGLAERKKLLSTLHIVSIVLSLLCVLLVWHYVEGLVKLYDAGSRVNMIDYNRALDLQQQVRRMNHV